MPDRLVTIAPKVGLHARPAARFVKAVTTSGCDVRIGRAGQKAVDAKSMLSVLSLSVQCGEQLVVSVDGDGAEAVIDTLARMLETDEDEPTEPKTSVHSA